MKSVICDAFNITKSNLMLLQPLILYMLVMSFAVLPLKAVGENSVAFFVILINLGLLTTAFCAGWFGMIKKAVIDFKNKNVDENKSQYALELLKEFFPSVGNYFLVTTFAFLIYSTLGFFLSFLIYKFAVHFFANQELVVQTFNIMLQPIDVQQKFLASLPRENLIILNKYLLLFAFCYFIFNVVTFFYMTAVFFTTKNPFKALYKSAGMFFKYPFFTMGIYFYLMIIGFVVSYIGILGNINLLLSLVTLFITIMFFTYYVMVIFLGYERKNNSNHGCNCEREIGSCN